MTFINIALTMPARNAKSKSRQGTKWT